MQPEYAHNAHRSIKPEYLIAVGICTHLGCSPSENSRPVPRAVSARIGRAASCAPATARPSIWPGGCTKNKPAPDNLEIPPHYYLSDTRILIGEDQSTA